MKIYSPINQFLPTIILFKPQMGANIGSVARAMKNCGLNDLRIIKPRDGWPNPETTPTAVGAKDIIDSAKIYSNLEESLNDISFLISTSTRKRDLNKKIVSPTEASKIIISYFKNNIKVAILFGAESSGLTNNEISISDLLAVIPLNPSFSSLNLSQAVLIMAWEFQKLFLKEGEKIEGYNNSIKNLNTKTVSFVQERELFFSRLEKLLEKKSFFPTFEMKPKIMRNIKDVFIRSKLTKQELSTFHGIISSLEKKN